MQRFTTHAHALFAMARPSQIVSVWAVALTGTFIADAYGHAYLLDRVLWGLLALTLVSASIHYANEYSDYETDLLSERTSYSGGSGAVGLIPRAHTLVAAWVSVSAGFLLALLLLLSGIFSPVTVVILAVGAFFGWMYSLPPLRLSWGGWGELDNALLGGVLLIVYGYSLLSATVPIEIVLLSIPFAALDFANLLATTYADREADIQTGKRTLATRLSDSQLRALHGFALVICTGGLLLLLGHLIPPEVGLLMLPVIPLMGWAWLRYTRTREPHASVHAMVGMLAAQGLGWLWVAL